ncbi:MAG: hypothetical protein WCG31_08170, partial [Deltaproteobacteria bacterium]
LTARNNRFELLFITIFLFALLFSFGLAFFKMSRLDFFDPYKINSISANNNLLILLSKGGTHFGRFF